MAARTATVVVNHGTRLLIDTGGERPLPCTVRGKRLRPVCGDTIEWEQVDTETGVVSRIVERTRALERADGRGGTAAIASSLDQVLVVIAPEPEPEPALIDRYLVMCERAGIGAALLANKSDSAPTGFMSRFDEFARAGYPVWSCSARTGAGLDALLQAVEGRATLLAGQSGVGKSSLLNALVPDLELQTEILSTATGEGRHTTTTTRGYRLPGGGTLVDSPGVREFWLPHMTRRELEHGFREIEGAGTGCRFRDCAHDKEPDCAVRAAVEAGSIARRRHDHYLALLKALC